MVLVLDLESAFGKAAQTPALAPKLQPVRRRHPTAAGARGGLVKHRRYGRGAAS
jgi:hypothetical protein